MLCCLVELPDLVFGIKKDADRRSSVLLFNRMPSSSTNLMVTVTTKAVLSDHKISQQNEIKKNRKWILFGFQYNIEGNKVIERNLASFNGQPNGTNIPSRGSVLHD
ncbi:hypothetical protein GJ496_002944 [Pomphorhynchus laevis]|nr:hypothetical protein GJ496_002944 [Pomphorhynchus laevis]